MLRASRGHSCHLSHTAGTRCARAPCARLSQPSHLCHPWHTRLAVIVHCNVHRPIPLHAHLTLVTTPHYAPPRALQVPSHRRAMRLERHRRRCPALVQAPARIDHASAAHAARRVAPPVNEALCTMSPQLLGCFHLLQSPAMHAPGSREQCTAL